MIIQDRFEIIALLIVLGVFSSSGGYGQTAEEKKILENYDPKTYVEQGRIAKSFGYPYCEDILRLREQENQHLLMSGRNELVTKRIHKGEISSDRSIALDVEKLKELQRPNSEQPLHTIYKRQEMHYSSGGGSCFTWKTTVTTLMSKIPSVERPVRDSEVNKTETQIEKLHAMWSFDVVAYGWVLSSTMAYFPDDKRYHVDCWANIQDTIYGVLDSGDEILITHLARGSSDEYTVESTPDHRFLTATFEWKRASELKSGDDIYTGPNSDPYKVIRISKHVIENGWFSNEPRARVFNLTTETSTFYVGSEKQRVLVHNLR